MLHPSKYNTFVATTLWYILTSVWVLPTPNAGQNQLFHVFCTFKQNFDAKIMKNVANISCSTGRTTSVEIYCLRCFWPYSQSLWTPLKTGENMF